MRSKIINFANIFFSLIFIIVVFGNYFLDIAQFYIDYNKLILFVLIVFLFIAFYGIFNLSNLVVKRFKIDKTITKFFYIFFKYLIIILTITIQLYIANLACFHTRWDCGTLISNACILATEDEDEINNDSQFNYNYFAMYPNNLLLTVCFKYIYNFSNAFTNKFFGQNLSYEKFYIEITMLNCLLLDLAAYLTYRAIKKIQGKTNAKLSLVFIVPLIMFTPYMLIPYSDTIGMFIPILIFNLFYSICNKTSVLNILKAFLIGLLLILGYYIKPTNIIVSIAIVITCFMYFRLNKVKQNSTILNIYLKMVIWFLSIICFASGIIFGRQIFKMAKQDSLDKYISVEKQEEKEFVLTHYLMMGLNVKGGINGTTAYGGYFFEDFNYTKSLKGKSEKYKYNIQTYLIRLKEYGFWGYLNFLLHKLNWILYDGNFFYAGEGEFYLLDPYDTTQARQSIQKFYNIYTDQYMVMAYFFQALWLVLLIRIIFSLTIIRKQKNTHDGWGDADSKKERIKKEIIKKDKKQIQKQELKKELKKEEKKEISVQKFLNISKLTILGLIIFLLLFEGRSRYLINHIPFFIFVGTYGLSQMFIFVKNIKKRK